MNQRPKTLGQVRAIFGEGRRASLDDEALRDLVEGVTQRTRSIRELTHAEAEKVILRLKGKGFVPLRTLQYRRAKSGVKQMVTREQLGLIAELATQRRWNPQTLAHFCKRQCKRERPRTAEDANKVIEALKSMNRREGLWAA